MTKYFTHILIAGMMILIHLACTKEITPDHTSMTEVQVDNVALSFTIKTESFGLHSSHLRSSGISGNIEYGKVEGTVNENRINNLWVFLFDRSNDRIKYMYHFRQNTSDPGSKLTGPFGQLDNQYQTPVKWIKPGRYALVISANTLQHQFQNDHMSLGIKDPFIEDIKPYVGMHINDFAKETRGSIHFANSSPAHDRDQPDKNGMNAASIDYHFVVPSNYTSEKEPFLVPVSLSRSLSKLVVTMSNLNEQGQEHTISRNYKIVEVVLTTSKLYKLFLQPWYSTPIGSSMNTKWYTHGILPLSPQTPYNVRPDGGHMREKFPLLKRLSQDGFTQPLKEEELFNYYIPPWAMGSDLQTAWKNTTKLKIVFEHKANGTRKTYEIPLYDIVKGEKNYTVRPNTLYRLRLTFRGNSLRSAID